MVYANMNADLMYCLHTVMYSTPLCCTMIYNHEGAEFIQ